MSQHSLLSGLHLHEAFHFVQESDPGAVGSSKYWLKVSTGTLKRRNAANTAWDGISPGFADPLTTKGDIVVRSASATSRLPVGATNGHALLVDSIETLGVKWVALTQPFATLTDAATVTWNCDITKNTQNAIVTLGGNRTLDIVGESSGMVGVLKVIQDGTGSRTLTLPGSSKVVSGGAGVITLTTTAAAIDVLSWTYDGTNFLWTKGLNFT